MTSRCSSRVFIHFEFHDDFSNHLKGTNRQSTAFVKNTCWPKIDVPSICTIGFRINRKRRELQISGRDGKEEKVLKNSEILILIRVGFGGRITVIRYRKVEPFNLKYVTSKFWLAFKIVHQKQCSCSKTMSLG